MIGDNHFFIAKDIATLLRELRILNIRNTLVQELIDSGYFEERLVEIEDLRNVVITIEIDGVSKPLNLWSPTEFTYWRKNINTVNDANISEVLVVLSQAAHNTILENKAWPRTVQMIALLSLFKTEHGGLAQIRTGEGKTLTIAMFAIIKFMEVEFGRQIDIVTSAETLAKRDAVDLAPFYNLFGITVDHNIRNSDGVKDCYLADIVYGDLLHFIGDTLRDIRQDIKHGRGFDLLIVDEIDNLFIDQNQMKVQLSGLVPGFEVLGQLLVYMWGMTTAVAMMLEGEEEECYINSQVLRQTLSTEQQEQFEELKESLGSDFDFRMPLNISCSEYLNDRVTEFMTQKVLAFEQVREERMVVIPNHLEKFVRNQLDSWLYSIFTAYLYQNKFHYTVFKPHADSGGIYNFTKITPVDYQNTGVLQHGLKWGDGLHQFLELKHRLTIHPEHVISIFMSYVGFFNKYKGNIYGVTGTLGSNSDHEFLKQVYQVDIMVIPRFIQQDLTRFAPLILPNQEQWQQEIIQIIQRKIPDQRTGLIIVETIAEVDLLKTALLQTGYNQTHIKIYGRGEHLEASIVKQELRPGDIIIATNLAGRGTDLQLSPEVIKNRGLHVILGIFASSLRVEEQAFGRSARKEEPGSAQLIINIENWHYGEVNSECQADLNCLKAMRDHYELQQLHLDQFVNLPRIMLRDELFNVYVELLREANSPTGYSLVVQEPQELESLHIYLYKKEEQIILKITRPYKPDSNEFKVEVLFIDPLLKLLNLRSYKHIVTILANPTSSISSLNSQDYELLHFIAVSRDFTIIPESYERVKQNFDLEMYKQGFRVPKRTYFSEILKKTLYNEKQVVENKYLTHLLTTQDNFTDLRPHVIDPKQEVAKEILEQVKLRKLYVLWLADRNLYNNNFEIEQLTESWGLWLKQSNVFCEHHNAICQETQNELKQAVLDQDQQKITELQNKLRTDMLTKFAEFKQNMLVRIKSKQLMQNPAYLVRKAWHYVLIDNKHSEYQAVRNEVSYGYSWYLAIGNTLSEKLHDFSNYLTSFFGSRISFGKDNYVVKKPLDRAVEFLDYAKGLDNIYAWTAYNTLGYIHILKAKGITDLDQWQEANEVKKRFLENNARAMLSIYDNIIPAFEAQLGFLSAHGLIDRYDDLTIQIIGNIKVYQALLHTMQRNIDKVTHSGGDHGIRLGKNIRIEDIINAYNVTSGIIEDLDRYFPQHVNQTESILDADASLRQQMNQTENIFSTGSASLKNLTQTIEFSSQHLVISQMISAGVIIFEIEEYKLHEDKDDWFGTIMCFALGIATIAMGYGILKIAVDVTIAAATSSSIFAASFGSGLVFQGVGDIISSIMSIANNQPIDMESYLISKGIGIGINLATASLLSIGHSAGWLNEMAINGILASAADPIKTVLFAGVTNIACTAASAVLNRAVQPILIDREEIEDAARNTIEELLNQEHELLQQIFSTDALNEDARNTLQDLLEEKIDAIVAKYQKKFRDHGTQFGMSVAGNMVSNVGSAFGIVGGIIGNIVNTATKLTISITKDDKALGKMRDSVRKAIHEVSAHVKSSGEIFKQKLIQDFTESIGTVTAGTLLFAAVEEQEYLNSGNIDCRACEKLNKVVLQPELEKYRNGLVGACQYVKQYIVTNQYTTEYAKIKNHFINRVTTAMYINKREISSDISSPIGGFFVEKLKGTSAVNEFLDKALNGIKDSTLFKGEAEKNAKSNLAIDIEKRRQAELNASIEKLRQMIANIDNKPVVGNNDDLFKVTDFSNKHHTIQDKESIIILAARYGVSIEALKAANPNMQYFRYNGISNTWTTNQDSSSNTSCRNKY